MMLKYRSESYVQTDEYQCQPTLGGESDDTVPFKRTACILYYYNTGIYAFRGIRNRGWLNGSIVGLVYMIILYLFSSLMYKNFTIDKYVITMTVIGVLTGAIGGIVGINVKKTTKYKHSV